MSKYREMANSAMKAKLARLGGKSSSKSPSEDCGPKGYATGGGVVDAGAIEGAASAPRMDKPSRGGKGKDKGKKGGTNVNVIIMPSGGGDKGAPMPPMDAGSMPPPGAGPGGPPPMPPGPPMRATGGRVPHIKEGAGGGLGRLAKVKAYGK